MLGCGALQNPFPQMLGNAVIFGITMLLNQFRYAKYLPALNGKLVVTLP